MGRIGKKKKVLFVNYNSYPCAVGGAELFNYYLVNALSKIFEIHVLTYCKKNKFDNEVISYHIKRTKFLKKFLSPLQTFIYLLKHKREISFFHVTFSTASWTHWLAYFLIYKILRINYMVTMHSGELAEWNPKYNWIYMKFFHNAKVISAVSERLIEEYRKRIKRDDIIYTPPLVPFKVASKKNLFRKKWGIGDDEKVLIYVGTLKPLKSVDTLINALSMISNEFMKEQNLKVLIIGDGVSKNELMNRVLELNLEDRVKFMGLIDTKFVHEFYNLADFYIICSIYEGLPISTLEAFANRIPCLTSDAPGLSNLSIERKNTLQYRTKDPVDLSNKLKLLIESEELQKELIFNGYDFYKRLFSYDKLIEKFVLIFNAHYK